MSDKQTCPGCDAYTSSVLQAFRDGERCPYCGLSAGAANEILAVQEKRADEELKEQLADAIKRREDAERKAARLERQLAAVRRALADDR